ncbi:Bug family tripartite tricarboxylate transporter substrate binding protein [Achromobacter aloeverae]|uniref:ABC transporter substrate-binding protein n=1 Tax=Achromobacter aloeverae TaxID=1750518 RepID=A0A4Q1HLW9_9BURK|nr:tripartite tricarboxylate transporter substrate binding protein [Achromobacter aloeverae]RXN91483.1 ABC transporter substrate-binding protein [Achromobacter aloeverae]
MPSFRRYLRGALAALAILPALAAAAYPDKPITLVVPWAAGGSTDILARLLSQHLTTSLGQSVIVENRSGASGNIGSAYVARAKPDGYTLLIGSMSTHTMNQALYATMPFDGVKDFTPIAELALVTNTMVVNPELPVKNVAEFIDYAKTHPLAYASAGAGSTNHLSAAMFEKATGIKMTHVPYRGGAPAVLDTVANRTQLLFSAGTQTLPHVKTGKLKLLAVTEDKRSPLLPDVPTVAETVPGYELAVWYGAFGPAGMDPALAERLNKEINRILALPEVQKQMGDIGVQVLQTTPQQFAEVLRRDADKYGKLVRELGIRAED